MNGKAEVVKRDLDAFYVQQSSEKTADFSAWLNSGDWRIPQSASYYYFEDRKIRNALEMAALPASSRILEIGCNLGQMTFPLAKMGYEMVGFDLSSGVIEKARARATFYNIANIGFEAQDGESYPSHKERSFDAVFSFSAFRYFVDPLKGLREAYRVLKKGGKAVIDFPNRLCPWFWLFKPMILLKPHIHDNLFSEKQVRDMMERAGFQDIEVRKFLFSWKELPPVFLPLMKTGDFILEHVPGIRQMSAIIMVKGVKL